MEHKKGTKTIFKSFLEKIRQSSCKHEEVNQMTDSSLFQNLRGQRVYTVCKKCGKTTNSVFYEHEGRGWK